MHKHIYYRNKGFGGRRVGEQEKEKEQDHCNHKARFDDDFLQSA